MDEPYTVGPVIGGSQSEPIDFGDDVNKIRIKSKKLKNGKYRLELPNIKETPP